MDSTLTNDRSTWQSLLEEITLGRRGQPVTLEVLDEQLGDQTPAHRLPLDSIGYDPRNDVIVIGLSGLFAGDEVVLRHLVKAPRSLDLLEQPHNSLVLQIVDEAEVQTLIAFGPDAAAPPV